MTALALYLVSTVAAVVLIGGCLLVAAIIWNAIERTIVARSAPAASVTPDRCRACGVIGFHEQGCGALDRLDLGGAA